MDGSFARAGSRDRQWLAMSPGDASADVLCVEELGVIIREATLRTVAQTGLLVIWDAIGHGVTVVSRWGLASDDRRAGQVPGALCLDSRPRHQISIRR